MDELSAIQPSFASVALAAFTKNNEHCEVLVDKDEILINKPWGSENARLRFATNNHALCDDLNNLLLNPRFDAIYHLDQIRIEFIYGYLRPEDEQNAAHLDRKFSVHYANADFDCAFEQPTQRLFRLARAFERLPSDTSDRAAYQLALFKDAQDLDKAPRGAKEYFADRVPRSFFVTPKGPIDGVNLPALARHINFLARYYDRFTPLIVIRESDFATPGPPAQRPLRHIESNFPSNLAVGQIDDVVMRLLEVASESQHRFAFLYLYQVLEYTGYYYLDDKVKNALRTFLKDPAVINCDDQHISELISIFSELTHNDDVKMRKVIEDNVDPRVIWREVEHDKVFFSAEQRFDGGFISSPLIAADTTIETWRAMWMPKTYDILTKIRNALVHARERRENKVILPTAGNNRNVGRYVPVLRRIAEQLALKAT